MATFASSVITMEAGDTLADIGTLGGTVVTTLDDRTTWTIPDGVCLTIPSGVTINHDTDIEQIVFLNGITGATNFGNTLTGQLPALRIASGGIYNFGVERGVDTGIWSDGVGWIFSGNEVTTNVNNQTGWANGSYTGRDTGCNTYLGGTLNINGGRIYGRNTWTFDNGSVVNNEVNAKITIDNSDQVSGAEWLTRDYGGTYNLTELDLVGGSYSIGTDSLRLSFNRSNAGVAYWNQGGGAANLTSVANTEETTLVVQDLSFANNTVDVATRAGTLILCRNIEQGSLVNVNAGEVNTSAVNNGAVFTSRNIETAYTDTTGATAQGALRIFDTNRFSRLTDPRTAAPFDNDDTRHDYLGTFNGTITNWTIGGSDSFAKVALDNLGFNDVILAKHTNLTGAARGTLDTGVWSWDFRSRTATLGTDDFRLHTWSYENQYNVTDEVLSGTGTFTYGPTLTPDAQVTLGRVAAAALTGITITNTTVAVTEANTLDNVYDFAKISKETTAALNTDDATTADFVFEGSDGLSTLNLDSTRSFTTSSIISAGTTNTTLAVDGTFSITGSGGFNGITLDRSGAAATTIRGFTNVDYIPGTGITTVASGVQGSTLRDGSSTYQTNAIINFSNADLLGEFTTVTTGSTFDNSNLSGIFPSMNVTRVSFCTLDGTFAGFTGTPLFSGNEVQADLGTTFPAGSYDGNVFNGGSVIDLSGTYTFSNGGTNGLTIEVTDNATGVDLTLENFALGTLTVPDVSAFTNSTAFQVTPTGTTDLDAISVFSDAGWTVNLADVVETIVIPTDAAGFYAVDRTINGVTTQHVNVTSFTQGEVVSFDIDDTSTNGEFVADRDSVTVYVKYNSTIGGTNAIYTERRQTVNYTGTQGASTTITAPSLVTNVLVGTAAAPAANVSFTTNIGTVNGVSISGGQLGVTIDNSAGSDVLSVAGPNAMGLAITIANTEDYFTEFYSEKTDTSMIEYQVNNGVGWNNERVTFASGDTSSGFNVQHRINQWSNTGTGVFSLSRSGAIEIDTPFVGVASLQQVTEAATIGIESATLNATITDIDTNVEAMRTNRLLGIAPQRADSGGDFELP